MGKSGKKVACQSQADLVDMADRLEGKGIVGTIVTILNDVRATRDFDPHLTSSTTPGALPRGFVTVHRYRRPDTASRL